MSTDSNPAGNDSMPDEIDATLGTRLLTLRLDAGMTQLQLAKRLGISAGDIEAHERGLVRINAWRLFELSRGLGVPLAKFAEAGRVSRSTAWDSMATVDQCRWQAMQLVMNFQLIEDAAMRTAILDFVRSAVRSDDDGDGDIQDEQPSVSPVFVRLADLSQRSSGELGQALCQPANGRAAV